jgi:hypothetical protein
MSRGQIHIPVARRQLPVVSNRAKPTAFAVQPG